MARGDDLVRLPAAVVENYDWQKDGSCVGMDQEIFFHPWNDTPRSRERRERAAKIVCSGCPVQKLCLDWSIKVQEPYGVWGGVGEDERRRILRKQRIV